MVAQPCVCTQQNWVTINTSVEAFLWGWLFGRRCIQPRSRWSASPPKAEHLLGGEGATASGMNRRPVQAPTLPSKSGAYLWGERSVLAASFLGWTHHRYVHITNASLVSSLQSWVLLRGCAFKLVSHPGRMQFCSIYYYFGVSSSFVFLFLRVNKLWIAIYLSEKFRGFWRSSIGKNC